MDYKERTERLRLEMEKRRREIEERIHNQRSALERSLKNSNIGKQSDWSEVENKSNRQERIPGSESKPANDKISIRMLTHFPGLEDASETKIGNFERLVQTYFEQQEAPKERFASYGYSDYDCSGIVNPLASIVEIEFKALLRDYIDEWGLVEKEGKKPTLGSIVRVYDHERGKDFLRQVFSSQCDRTNEHHTGDVIDVDSIIQRSHNQFKKILSVRNYASHDKVLSLWVFLDFYDTYYTFFHETIKAIVDYKSNLPKKRNKSKSNNGGTYSPHWKSAPTSRQRNDESELPAKKSRLCVIFTDLDQLSLKYFTDINHKEVGSNVIYSGPNTILTKYIKPYCLKGARHGITYFILNTADPSVSKLIGEDKSWKSYLAILDSFCLNPPHFGETPLVINGDNPADLFIIGGDDVIPMPKVANPGVSRQEIIEKRNALESSLEADWLYSFPSADISITKDGNLEYESLAGKKPRFFVSRLPMENGLLETSIDDDLKGYFERASNEREGIKIDRFSMVACDSAKIVANAIVEGLPVTPPSPSIGEGCFYGNVYVSPCLSIEVNSKSTQDYIGVLAHTDLLSFVLHGNQNPNSPYYKGQAFEYPYDEPIAFSPELFSACRAKVVAPICCWGARFINYRRDKSTLLTSMFSNGLIFFGSCRSARGSLDIGHMAGMGITLAEKLQRFFLVYLLAGYPAGEALSRAKCRYLCNPCGMPAYDLMTVLQFNLFGDPTLRLRPVISNTQIIKDTTPSSSVKLPSFKVGTFSADVTTVANFDKNDVLARVRNLVDSNLNDIMDRLNKLLTEKLNISQSSLRKIEKWRSPVMPESYCFQYCPTGIEGQLTYVFTSVNGDVKEVFCTI